MSAGRRRRSVLGRLGLVALTAAAAGCSKAEPPKLDVAQVRPTILKAVEAQIRLPVGDLRCPATARQARGVGFACTATVASSPLRIQVTERDAEGDLRVTLADAVVRPADVQADLEARLKQAFRRTFRADCGSVAPRVVAPGTIFRCRAHDASTNRVVVVRVRDAAGALSYRVLPLAKPKATPKPSGQPMSAPQAKPAA